MRFGPLLNSHYFASVALPAISTAVLPVMHQTAHCQPGPEPSISSLVRRPDTLSSSPRWSFNRILRTFWRFLRLWFTLTPMALFYPILLLKGKSPEEDAHKVLLSQSKDQMNWLVATYLRLCRLCVESSGAAVIKLFQWASSRPDLFGHDFCEIFSSLQEATTPHRLSHTKRALSRAFGADWENRIELQEILGSGCIGQVYKAHLLNDKMQTVAIKILHPNVHRDIDADLDLMRLAVRTMESLNGNHQLQWLNLPGIVEEFAGLLRMQLDLRTEAQNLRRFNELFEGDKKVEFPKLIDAFPPTRDVLVESFCEGVSVLDFARANQSNPEKLYEMCRIGIQAVTKMIFLHNFCHSDLHMGNVRIRQGKFILLDVGMVAEYSEEDHKVIVKILSAFIRKDGRLAAQHMVTSTGSDSVCNVKEFEEKMEALTEKAKSKDYLMENLGSYITYICQAASDHHIRMNPSFISAALAVKIQEGIALALDPSIDLPKIAIPIIVESERRAWMKWAREEVGQWADSLFGSSQNS